METPGPDPESILVPPETTIIEVEPPTSLVEYTETVERLCKQLDRDKSTKVVLCIRGGPLVVPVCTAAALQRYELALAKFQKRSLLLVAALDGALCDLSLSLALACDFRLATADTCLPARPASQATGATQPYVPLPIWWLASLALHAGVLRAQKLLWRTQPVGTHELLDCHVVHALCPNVAALRAARLPVPPNVPLALLRRIVLQTFSVAGTDVIGHSLAVSSLVIADAVGRAAAAHAPLPPLVPLEFEMPRSEEAWVLTMPSELELISLDELSKVLEQLNRGLAALAATGEPLPTCLVLRMLASERAARLPMPQQLLALHAGGGANGHFNMRLVSWLTKLEKALTSLNTLPLPTVCVLAGTGSVGATALQIAFACDLRAAAPSVTLDFGAASGTLPGTLAFRLAKHVGAGVAMALMAQDSPLGSTEALRVGALQWIVAPKAAAADAPAAEVGAWLGSLLARAAHGASLLLCRYLLQDTIWMARPEELRAMLKVWHTAPAAATSDQRPLSFTDAGGGGEEVVEGAPPVHASKIASKISSAQLEQLASFFPDQFIMPTEAWQWKLEWARAGAHAAQEAAAERAAECACEYRAAGQPRVCGAAAADGLRAHSGGARGPHRGVGHSRGGGDGQAQAWHLRAEDAGGFGDGCRRASAWAHPRGAPRPRRGERTPPPTRQHVRLEGGVHHGARCARRAHGASAHHGAHARRAWRARARAVPCMQAPAGGLGGSVCAPRWLASQNGAGRARVATRPLCSHRLPHARAPRDPRGGPRVPRPVGRPRGV